MSEAKRLVEMEERYVHLQHHVTEQDKAMLELSEEVARLRKEINLLRLQVTAAAAEPGEVADDRPPHY